MESKDYLKAFTMEKYFNFDETNFAFSSFSQGKSYQQIRSEVESMTHVVKRYQQENELKAYFEMNALEGIPGRMKWENGRLAFKEKYEVILYHLRLFKRYFKPSNIPSKIPNTFYIDKGSISH